MNAKYIRTQAGIYQIKNGQFLGNWDVEKYSRDFPVRFADNIKDLCDGFVFDGGDDVPLLCDNYEELIYWFNHSKEQQYKTRNCYGAIWTGNGLIYVAKINEHRELELLYDK